VAGGYVLGSYHVCKKHTEQAPKRKFENLIHHLREFYGQLVRR
jgi:hypothetical protein